MITQWYLNTCVQFWTFFAQTTPAGAQTASAPATAAPPAAAATGGAPAAATTSLPPASMPSVTTTPPPIAPMAHTMIWQVMHGLSLFAYFVVSVALIVCVMFQTTKSEGLSGMIGGTVNSTQYRGRKSDEEMLVLWTSRLAVTFVVLSFFIWLFFGRAATAAGAMH